MLLLVAIVMHASYLEYWTTRAERYLTGGGGGACFHTACISRTLAKKLAASRLSE